MQAAYWRRHVREPVRFFAGMRALRQLGCDGFVEIGPQPTLVGMGSGVSRDDGLLVAVIAPRPRRLAADCLKPCRYSIPGARMSIGGRSIETIPGVRSGCQPIRFNGSVFG